MRRICPAQARIFGDLKNAGPDDPIRKFHEDDRVEVLKPYLGTEPRVSTPVSTRRSDNMTGDLTNLVSVITPKFEGYVYPNEAIPHPLWGSLIVLYPYITGLVAGAFIMASLVRVFKVRALEPVYRLAMLTALSFLLCATLPLLFHLGHPERCYGIMMTPHFTSPMAMFGFVYAWYLMAVLLLELWFDFRHDLVRWSRVTPGFRGSFTAFLRWG